MYCTVLYCAEQYRTVRAVSDDILSPLSVAYAVDYFKRQKLTIISNEQAKIAVLTLLFRYPVFWKRGS